jgi:hypothetical protein
MSMAPTGSQSTASLMTTIRSVQNVPMGSFDASSEYLAEEDSEEDEDNAMGFSSKPVVDGSKHPDSR